MKLLLELEVDIDPYLLETRPIISQKLAQTWITTLIRTNPPVLRDKNGAEYVCKVEINIPDSYDAFKIAARMQIEKKIKQKVNNNKTNETKRIKKESN